MELEQEAQSTRKMLERLPADKLTWKPHEKSMTLGRLAMHLAEIPGWVNATLLADELDFEKMDYKPVEAASSEEAVKKFDETLAAAIETLKKTDDAEMMKNWTMRSGDQVYFTMPKIAVLRGFVYSHLVHHRGQMSVYLRLLDVPVPGSYGPSADDPGM
ncbi:MAG: DinB family protein [Ignavibacteria bacterium]|nr:DinB family protein [Ignavibacteria bacterium]